MKLTIDVCEGDAADLRLGADPAFGAWLKDNGLEPTRIYRIELDDGQAAIFQYSVDEEGRKYVHKEGEHAGEAARDEPFVLDVSPLHLQAVSDTPNKLRGASSTRGGPSMPDDRTIPSAQLGRVRAAGETSMDVALIGLVGRAWSLRPEAMEVLVSAIQAGQTINGYLDDEEMPAQVDPKRAGDVAVIPLSGMIMPNGGGFLSMLLGGGGGLKSFKAQLAAAAADEEVKAIVLDIDSPGGLVDLVPETAAFVREVAAAKPVTAVANTMAASAAYWIASAATELVVTPSGELGSIGVYMMHTDSSKALEASGINITLTSAGKYKTEGNSYEPLSDEAQAAFQREVNLIYGSFVKDVALGRGTSEAQVREGYGQGRSLRPPDAVNAGLADRVATLEEVVGEYADAPMEPADVTAQAAAQAALSAELAEMDALIELGRV